ncbi:MAG: STT3 domain-containing protein [Myxococcota bacterium]|nr:STT3 domain-containing protein [Myxococcota bacterium]
MKDLDLRGRPLIFIGLVVLAAAALGIRALGFEYVFVGGEVVFPPADPQYHLRRALFTMMQFPDVLLFDPYINFPGGAPVPWPPLFDWLLGAGGWLAGGTTGDLERVAAWAPPVCAALSIWPLYLAGCQLSSRRVGFLAGFFFALLPISVVYTRLGNADHHGAVALIGAWLLYCLLGLVDPAASRVRMIALAGLLTLLSSLMLLTWHGSLLYLAPAQGLLLVAGILSGRRRLLVAQACSAFLAGCGVVLWLVVSPTPLGGDYSSIALSRLHALALGAAFITAGLLWCVIKVGLADTVLRRFLWAAGLVVALGMAIVFLPGPREGLELAYQFLTLSDQVGASTGEQTPLFSIGNRLQGPPASRSWGLFAYLLPVIPLAAWFAGRRPTAEPGARAAGWVLFAWGLFFCLLASLQRRYGNDAAPAAALLFALLLSSLADRLGQVIARRSGPRTGSLMAFGLSASIVLLGFWPAFRAVYQPRVMASWSAWQNPLPSEGASSKSIAATLHQFAGQVREWTPETSGYLESGRGPEYGIIAHPNLGHALQYRARRATATDPFWWYIGRENWDRTEAFLRAKSEPQALALARSLEARYVITMPDLSPGTILARLHDRDGRADGALPSLNHFRLVGEAPPGGLPIGAIFDRRGEARIPYKLFEIVPGAVIEVSAPPGTPVEAKAQIQVPRGRRFSYRVVGLANEQGSARLRVPYPTFAGEGETLSHGARAIGGYRIRVGQINQPPVEISERAVRVGRVVRGASAAERGVKSLGGRPS